MVYEFQKQWSCAARGLCRGTPNLNFSCDIEDGTSVEITPQIGLTEEGVSFTFISISLIPLIQLPLLHSYVFITQVCRFGSHECLQCDLQTRLYPWQSHRSADDLCFVAVPNKAAQNMIVQAHHDPCMNVDVGRTWTMLAQVKEGGGGSDLGSDVQGDVHHDRGAGGVVRRADGVGVLPHLVHNDVLQPKGNHIADCQLVTLWSKAAPNDCCLVGLYQSTLLL